MSLQSLPFGSIVVGVTLALAAGCGGRMDESPSGDELAQDGSPPGDKDAQDTDSPPDTNSPPDTTLPGDACACPTVDTVLSLDGQPCACAEFGCKTVYDCPAGVAYSSRCTAGVWDVMVQWDTYCQPPDAGPGCVCPTELPFSVGTPCDCADTASCPGTLVCPAGEVHTPYCENGVWADMVQWDSYCPADAGAE